MTGAEVTESIVHIAEIIAVVFAFAGLFAAGFVVRITQHRAQEWKDLALARSAVVDDLKAELGDLKAEVGQLRGAITALESVKAQEIAERVAEHLHNLMGVAPSVETNHRGDA